MEYSASELTVRALGVDPEEARRLVHQLDNEQLVGEFAQICANLGADGAAVSQNILLLQHISEVTRAFVRWASLLRSELLQRLPGPQVCLECRQHMTDLIRAYPAYRLSRARDFVQHQYDAHHIAIPSECPECEGKVVNLECSTCGGLGRVVGLDLAIMVHQPPRTP